MDADNEAKGIESMNSWYCLWQATLHFSHELFLVQSVLLLKCWHIYELAENMILCVTYIFLQIIFLIQGASRTKASIMFQCKSFMKLQHITAVNDLMENIVS